MKLTKQRLKEIIKEELEVPAPQDEAEDVWQSLQDMILEIEFPDNCETLSLQIRYDKGNRLRGETPSVWMMAEGTPAYVEDAIEYHIHEGSLEDEDV